MHSTSIVGFLLIFLGKKMLVSAKWVLPVSIIVLLLGENIMQILGIVIEKTRFGIYLTGKFAQGKVSILNIAENVIVYLWMYFIYRSKRKNGEKIERQATLFLNIQGLALLVTVAGACHMHFARIALYFVAFQILSIPYYIEIMPFKQISEKIKEKLKKEIDEKQLKKVTIVLLIIGFLGMFGYTNILNNDNGVLPYKTIFTSEKKKIPTSNSLEHIVITPNEAQSEEKEIEDGEKKDMLI